MCKQPIYTSPVDFNTDTATSEPATKGTVSHELLLAAISAVLAPLARLAVARGLPCAEVEEVLRAAFVEAAKAAHPGIAAHRAVSRISAATGLNRREVTRLVQAAAPESPKRRSPATEVFTRWLSDPQYRGSEGTPLALPRQGAAPSFEALAQSVTRDVHPRSLVEELCRLGLARINDRHDTVELLRETYVPEGDERRLFGFLGANVGDHLSAAAANVLSTDGPQHLEQALFADELSQHSVAYVRPLITAQWQALVRSLAPEVQRLIEEDRAAGRPQDQRLRVGLYEWHAPMPALSIPPNSATDPQQ
jgi:hypothetical protein